MKYENGGNLRSTAAPQIRRVLSRPKNDQFWRVFYLFPPIFLLFHPPYAYTKPILQKKSGLAWIFWPRWRLKVFASTQGGLPPPTQLTNTNIKIMKIRVSWVGQSTTPVVKLHKRFETKVFFWDTLIPISPDVLVGILHYLESNHLIS